MSVNDNNESKDRGNAVEELRENISERNAEITDKDGSKTGDNVSEEMDRVLAENNTTEAESDESMAAENAVNTEKAGFLDK